MKLSEIRIQNFRSFDDQTIPLENYTCLVGPNGSGKSAVLMALNVFFRENEATVTPVLKLTREDFHHGNIEEPVKITLTFEGLPDNDDESISPEARDLLNLYARHGKLILFAKAEWDANTETAPVKQYGSRLVMEEFASFFEAEKKKARVGELKDIYADIKKHFPDLPDETRKQQMHDALRSYEESLPKERKKHIEETNEFYGFTRGLYRLEEFVQWVYIPAVKDASSEQEEGSKTALGKLLQRTVRNKIDFSQLDTLREETQGRYKDILDAEKGVLKDLSLSIQAELREWTNPLAALELEWESDSDKSVEVREPRARANVGEDSFIDKGISRMGHGMQRGFLVAILKEMVRNVQKEGPKLLLGFEEPELYQHPPQAQHMLSMLERLVEPQNNSQVIVTSHSPYFVSSKGFESIRMFRKCGQRPCSVVKGTNYEKVRKKLTDAFGKEKQSPSSLMATVGQIMQASQKEMFFSPVIVLVEGEEDVAYISTHLNLTGEWKTFRRNGCHFVVAGGKNNVPRLLGIPAFVVFDSDMERSNRKIEKAEELAEDEPKRQEKIKSAKAELNKQNEINRAIARLCGYEIENPTECKTIFNDSMVMWKGEIGEEVVRSFRNGQWEKTQSEIVEKYDFKDVRTKGKNCMIIVATLEELHKNEKKSSALINLCSRISRYAQKCIVLGT